MGLIRKPGSNRTRCQGDTIPATRQPDGNLVFGEIVSKIRNAHLSFQCKVAGFTNDVLIRLLGDDPGSEDHLDPTPGLQALLDRVLDGGGNFDFEYATLSLHLSPGFELTARQNKLLEDGDELLITAARLRFNQLNSPPDPSRQWEIKLPGRK